MVKVATMNPLADKNGNGVRVVQKEVILSCGWKKSPALRWITRKVGTLLLWFGLFGGLAVLCWNGRVLLEEMKWNQAVIDGRNITFSSGRKTFLNLGELSNDPALKPLLKREVTSLVIPQFLLPLLILINALVLSKAKDPLQISVQAMALLGVCLLALLFCLTWAFSLTKFGMYYYWEREEFNELIDVLAEYAYRSWITNESLESSPYVLQSTQETAAYLLEIVKVCSEHLVEQSHVHPSYVPPYDELIDSGVCFPGTRLWCQLACEVVVMACIFGNFFWFICNEYKYAEQEKKNQENRHILWKIIIMREKTEEFKKKGYPPPGTVDCLTKLFDKSKAATEL